VFGDVLKKRIFEKKRHFNFKEFSRDFAKLMAKMVEAARGIVDELSRCV